MRIFIKFKNRCHEGYSIKIMLSQSLMVRCYLGSFSTYLYLSISVLISDADCRLIRKPVTDSVCKSLVNLLSTASSLVFLSHFRVVAVTKVYQSDVLFLEEYCGRQCAGKLLTPVAMAVFCSQIISAFGIPY